MKSNHAGRRLAHPILESLERRETPTTVGPLSALQNPPGYPPVRPNTPVLPYGAGTGAPTFIDTSARLENPQNIIISWLVYVAPFATVDARGGIVKIGVGSSILDNTNLIAKPTGSTGKPTLLIGNNVVVNSGATIVGSSTIGSYSDSAAPTKIGANSFIDNATIEPGAIVGALARVGPGITVPSGMYVLPGVSITTEAQATNPSLGMVRAVSSSEASNLAKFLQANQQLSTGYRNLYLGNTAAGVSPFFSPTISNVNNGVLPQVEGASPSPITKTNTASKDPSFLYRKGSNWMPKALIYNFPARVVGAAQFFSQPLNVQNHLGRRNSIRADEGTPLTFLGAPKTGMAVSINAPVQGAMQIGKNVKLGNKVVIQGGPGAAASTLYTIGDDVTIQSGSAIDRSNIGAGSIIGARSFIQTSTLAANTVIPPGTMMINNVVTGHVQW